MKVQDQTHQIEWQVGMALGLQVWLLLMEAIEAALPTPTGNKKQPQSDMERRTYITIFKADICPVRVHHSD